MKNTFLILFIAAILICAFSIVKGKKDISITAKNNTSEISSKDTHASTGFALVELFTSEGCSSCPPADKLISELSAEKKENIYILAYHVDYWNRLGWKDAFSKAEYSARQQDYASQLDLNSVYTPQIVVNGQQEFVGSDKEKLYRAVKEVTSITRSNVQIKIKSVLNGKKIHLILTTRIDNTAKLNIALVALSASSKVMRGENAGRVLNHVNIVRDFKSIPASSDIIETDFNLPTDIGSDAGNYEVITFLQKNAGEIIAVNKSSLQ